jgi:hypothetical protein
MQMALTMEPDRHAFTLEIDNIQAERWADLIPEFEDSSIYQTWSAGAIQWGAENLSHALLKKHNEAVGLAQVRIRSVPFVPGGVATIFWGPMWKRKGMPTDKSCLDKMIACLKAEYAIKRGLLLRIWPIGFEGEGEEAVSILTQHGFIKNPVVEQYKTLLLHLSLPLEELRKNLSSKWRNQLNVAEKNNLSLIEGDSDELFTAFLGLLHETMSRKQFTSGVSPALYSKIQRDLPGHLKMRVFLCVFEGEPIAGGVFSAMGGTGSYLLGATANKGLKLNGSNLLHWAVIKWLKNLDCKTYDLGGIDPTGNAGVYHFKKGITGKIGKEVIHPGQFYYSSNFLSSMFSTFIDRTSYVRNRFRKFS